MERCPFCGSEDIYYSKKRKIFVCEDCDETFSEHQLSTFQDKNQSKVGLDLFFSYGHDKNRVLVERIKQDLEKRGHRVWIDTSEIKAGDHWRNDILNGVMKSANVIAFLSEHSTRNPGVCLDELKIAVCVKGANVKTVLLEPENRIKQPSTLSDIQWLDMSEWSDIRSTSLEQFESWYQLKFEELCSAIEADDSFELNGEIHTLKEKLSPYLNTEKEYRLLSKEFYGRKWVEDYIEDWQDRQQTKSLVIYGKPGSGKSAFCVNYSHYNSDVYGCFLCEWNREFSINPHQLIRTMAFRLATKLTDYRKLLLHQLEQVDNGLAEMKDDALFEFLLSYPLNHLVDGGREIGMIIVDGLDEAEKDGINPLAAVFARCVERLPRWIRFIFTSRPEKSVISLFEGAKTLDLVNDMPDGYNDIMAYLLRALSIELKSIPNRLEVLNKICELSEGVFLYAELLVDDVKNGAIDLSNPDCFPRGLGDFYRVSMERMFENGKSYERVRRFLELLVVSDSIPEQMIINVCNYSKYEYLSVLDLLGAWINRQEGQYTIISFAHKSLSDWLTDEQKSGQYYVDKKYGAHVLARYSRQFIHEYESKHPSQVISIFNYVSENVGNYFLIAEKYEELEDLLIEKQNDLFPYWKAWRCFPEKWDNKRLLSAFWGSPNRDVFLKNMLSIGNTSYLLWVFSIAQEQYGIEHFDHNMLTFYIDAVHLTGRYINAVEISNEYLSNYNKMEVVNDEFMSMLTVRTLHHKAFYAPVGKLVDEALAFYGIANSSKHFQVINELLIFIGGKYGLMGEWDKSIEWLFRSEEWSQSHHLEKFSKRNVRKICEYYCCKGDYKKALALIPKEVYTVDVSDRYDVYLLCVLANIYTCLEGKEDEALHYYNEGLNHSTVRGIRGWIGHSYLGLANVHYKLNNIREASDFAGRALAIYKDINQEWGQIMSNVLISACESKLGIAPIQVACNKYLVRAERSQYGSCVSSINELISGQNNYLKLYFI